MRWFEKRSFTRLLEECRSRMDGRFGGCRAAFLFCGGVVFLLGFLGKCVFRCGAFVVNLWWSAW